MQLLSGIWRVHPTLSDLNLHLNIKSRGFLQTKWRRESPSQRPKAEIEINDRNEPVQAPMARIAINNHK